MRVFTNCASFFRFCKCKYLTVQKIDINIPVLWYLISVMPTVELDFCVKKQQ